MTAKHSEVDSPSVLIRPHGQRRASPNLSVFGNPIVLKRAFSRHRNHRICAPFNRHHDDRCSSQKRDHKHPAHSNERNYPNNVTSPPPGLMAKVWRLPQGRCPQPAASLDIARVWRSPSAIAPAITNRGYQEQKYECHPQNPPRAHHRYLAFPLLWLTESRPVRLKLGHLAAPVLLISTVCAMPWTAIPR